MADQPLNYESRTRPPPKHSGPVRARHYAAILVGVVFLPLLVSLLIPSLQHRNHADGYRIKCASNLRQIGLAVEMYANDNKGRLPPDLATVLVTQDLTSEAFVCPASDDDRATGPTAQALLQDFAKPGRCSFLLASPLPSAWNLLTPAHVLAYEPPSNHHDGMNVLYGDGQVRWVGKPGADRIVSELKAGHNPPQASNSEGNP